MTLYFCGVEGGKEERLKFLREIDHLLLVPYEKTRVCLPIVFISFCFVSFLAFLFSAGYKENKLPVSCLCSAEIALGNYTATVSLLACVCSRINVI